MLIRNEDPDPREEEIEVPADDGDLPPEIEAVEDEEPEVVEPEEGDEPELEDEPVEPRRAQPTKEENMAALRARARRAEEDLARERQQRAQPSPVQQQETPQARHARLAAMSPEDRANTIAGENEERLHRVAAFAEFRVAEAQDKADFNDMVRGDPRLKQYAKPVEDILLAERQQGKNWPRATVLKFILGERMLANAPKAKKLQDAAGKSEFARQKGSPEKPKGDKGGGKQRLSESQARAARLKGATF